MTNEHLFGSTYSLDDLGIDMVKKQKPSWYGQLLYNDIETCNNCSGSKFDLMRSIVKKSKTRAVFIKGILNRLEADRRVR